jgi:hypothetical protein
MPEPVFSLVIILLVVVIAYLVIGRPVRGDLITGAIWALVLIVLALYLGQRHGVLR